MSIELIDTFNVVSLNDRDARPLKTYASHLVSNDGTHDVVRIEQEEFDEDADNVVVILTRKDFDRIANQLKGH